MEVSEKATLVKYFDLRVITEYYQLFYLLFGCLFNFLSVLPSISFTYFDSFIGEKKKKKSFSRITEWWRLEGTSGGHLVQSRVPKTTSSVVLNISDDGEDGDFTICWWV